MPYFVKIGDFGNESVAYFYIGKSYRELNKPDKAVPFFKKVDLLFKKEQYIRPDLREGYEYLIDYYKQRNDTKAQLFYINQLLAVDRVLGVNYKYLLTRVAKEYDTKELIKAKEEITTSMTYRTVIGCGIIFLMAVFITYLFYKNYRNKKSFEDLMRRTKAIASKYENRGASIDITPELELTILKKLEKFELGKKYLEKDMNLVRMAALLHTNTKYVTKIIAKHRNKGTIEYITDLKTDYIIELLKTESKYRNYTNKALADEVGFGSTQNFTKAFKARTDITPTYFIHKLKQTLAETSN